MTTTQPPTPIVKDQSVLMDILDKIETCIQNKESGCDVTKLKTDFVVNMSMALGAKYAGTYAKMLPKLFDMMVQSPPPSPTEMIAIIGSMMLTFIINTIMSLISGIPGFGEIDPIYIALNQAMTLFPILNKIKNIMSVNILELLMGSGSITQLSSYINRAVDAMVKMKGLDERMAAHVKESVGKVNLILERLYTEVNEYVKKHKTDETVAQEKGTLGKLQARFNSLANQMKEFVNMRKSEPSPPGVVPVEEKKYLDRMKEKFASMSKQLKSYLSTSSQSGGGKSVRRKRTYGGSRLKKTKGNRKHKRTYKRKTRRTRSIR